MRHLYAATSDGHFVDRSVGKITDLEKGDQVADAVATAIEFFAVLGVFAIPIFMLFGALRNRKVTTIAGGVVALAGVLWYRSIGDWDQRQNSILNKWQIPVGDWVEQVTIWVDLNMKETLAAIKWPFQTMLEIIVDDLSLIHI